GASSGPLGRDGLLRSLEEGERHGEELVGALEHGQMATTLDHVGLRLRKDPLHVAQMLHRQYVVLAAPERESGTGVLRTPCDPRLAKRPPNAPDVDARRDRADEFRERGVPVSNGLLVELFRDARGVVEAGTQRVASGVLRARKSREK